MKHPRLLLTSLAVLVAGNVAIAAACDQSKQTKASAASVAAAASKCPYADAAACKAAKTSAAGYASGACSHSASTAAGEACSHAKGVSASAVCTDKASAAGKSACSGHGMATIAARSSHGDCDACQDMANCEQEIESAGASTQVVPLKNGVMYVYTADTPDRVRIVQAAMGRRNEHLVQLTSGGAKAHLCTTCKQMRGAAASGKLSRELVNIEGGCLTLLTSNDPTVVAKIYAMAGITSASKVKS